MRVLTARPDAFNTYCSPCHDQTGMGKGMVPDALAGLAAAEPDGGSHRQYGGRRYLQRDHVRPADHAALWLSSDRPEDRWAIIAYVRALQRAAHGT